MHAFPPFDDNPFDEGRTRAWQLRPRTQARIVPGVENEALAAILAAIQEQGEAIAALAGAVTSMAESRAHGDASGEHVEVAAPVGPPQAVLSELVACEDGERYFARVKLGKQGRLAGPLLDLFATYGGRGLYRSHAGYRALHEASMDFRRAVIRDAMPEDAREAADMGADLLKAFDVAEAPA
jgi:hypothetical protein